MRLNYVATPKPETISVQLLWIDGKRFGEIHLPASLSDKLYSLNYPSASGDMALENALAYAIYIALVTRSQLLVTGDQTVWDSQWGILEFVGVH